MERARNLEKNWKFSEDSRLEREGNRQVKIKLVSNEEIEVIQGVVLTGISKLNYSVPEKKPGDRTQ